jgi:hypothetical protein
MPNPDSSAGCPHGTPLNDRPTHSQRVGMTGTGNPITPAAKQEKLLGAPFLVE